MGDRTMDSIRAVSNAIAQFGGQPLSVRLRPLGLGVTVRMTAPTRVDCDAITAVIRRQGFAITNVAPDVAANGQTRSEFQISFTVTLPVARQLGWVDNDQPQLGR